MRDIGTYIGAFTAAKRSVSLVAGRATVPLEAADLAVEVRGPEAFPQTGDCAFGRFIEPGRVSLFEFVSQWGAEVVGDRGKLRSADPASVLNRFDAHRLVESAGHEVPTNRDIVVVAMRRLNWRA